MNYPCYMKSDINNKLWGLALNENKLIVIERGGSGRNEGDTINFNDSGKWVNLTPGESYEYVISKLKVDDDISYDGVGMVICDVRCDTDGLWLYCNDNYDKAKVYFWENNTNKNNQLVINKAHLPVDKTETSNKGREIMKYKSIKPITLMSLIKDDACNSSLTYIQQNVQSDLYEEIIWNTSTENIATNDISNGIEFLLIKGYIELNKPELIYNSDKVYTVMSQYNYGILKLTKVNDRHAFRSLNDSNSTGPFSCSSGEEAIQEALNDKYEVKEFDNIVEALKYYDLI